MLSNPAQSHPLHWLLQVHYLKIHLWKYLPVPSSTFIFTVNGHISCRSHIGTPCPDRGTVFRADGFHLGGYSSDVPGPGSVQFTQKRCQRRHFQSGATQVMSFLSTSGDIPLFDKGCQIASLSCSSSPHNTDDFRVEIFLQSVQKTSFHRLLEKWAHSRNHQDLTIVSRFLSKGMPRLCTSEWFWYFSLSNWCIHVLMYS